MLQTDYRVLMTNRLKHQIVQLRTSTHISRIPNDLIFKFFQPFMLLSIRTCGLELRLLANKKASFTVIVGKRIQVLTVARILENNIIPGQRIFCLAGSRVRGRLTVKHPLLELGNNRTWYFSVHNHDEKLPDCLPKA